MNKIKPHPALLLALFAVSSVVYAPEARAYRSKQGYQNLQNDLHRARSNYVQRIRNNTYSQGVTQRQRAVGGYRTRIRHLGGGQAVRRNASAVMRARCTLLTRISQRRRIDYSLLQDYLLPAPPGVALSWWNGGMLRNRVEWYAKRCPLPRASYERLYRRTGGTIKPGSHRAAVPAATQGRAKPIRRISLEDVLLTPQTLFGTTPETTRKIQIRRLFNAPIRQQPRRLPLLRRQGKIRIYSRATIAALRDPNRVTLRAGQVAKHVYTYRGSKVTSATYTVFEAGTKVFTRTIQYLGGRAREIVDQQFCGSLPCRYHRHSYEATGKELKWTAGKGSAPAS